MSQTTHTTFGGASVTTACLRAVRIPTTGQRTGRRKTATDQPVTRTRWTIKIQSKSLGPILKESVLRDSLSVPGA